MRFAATTIGGLDRLPAGLIGINGFYPGLGGSGTSLSPAKRQKQAPLGVYLEEEPFRERGRAGWSSENREKHQLRLINDR